MYVFVCQTITFKIFAHPVYLHGMPGVKFVHEGHRVKVKVTVSKKVANACSCIDQLPPANFHRYSPDGATDVASRVVMP